MSRTQAFSLVRVGSVSASFVTKGFWRTTGAALGAGSSIASWQEGGWVSEEAEFLLNCPVLVACVLVLRIRGEPFVGFPFLFILFLLTGSACRNIMNA